MAARAKKNKQDPGGARKAEQAANAHAADTQRTDASYWAVDTSWSLLIAALIVTPLLMTNTSWLPGAHAVWLHSGASAFKALVMQALVGGSLAAFSVALYQRKAVVRWHRVAWLALALLAWSGLTVITSVSPATALIGYVSNWEGWMALLTYATAAFLTLQLTDSPGRIHTLLRASTLTAAVVALYGLMQTLGADPLKWKPAQWGTFRSFSTVGNPDMFGAFMVLNLFVAVGLLLSEKDNRWRWGYSIASLLIGAATFTSLARAAWLGGVAGLIVFAVLMVRLKPHVRRVEVVLSGALVVVIVAAALFSLVNSDVDSNAASRLLSAFNSQDKNTLGRTETWRIAAVAIGHRPVVGYGPDTFVLAFQPNKTEQWAGLVDPNIVQANAHSGLIQVAVERGVPGAVLWLALLAAVVVVSLPGILAGDERTLSARLLQAGVLASGAGYFVALALTPTSHESSLLLWCMLAVLVSPQAVRLARSTPKALAAGALVLGLVGVMAAGTFLYADTQAATADDETVASPARIAAANRAVQLDPLNADYAAVAAKAYAQAIAPDTATPAATALFDKADAQLRRSVALAPTDPHTRSTLVGLLLIGGAKIDPRYFDQAVTAAQSALQVAPNDLEAAYWYARALNADGKAAQAIPVLERVLSTRPQYVDAVILLSDLYVDSGETGAARALLNRTIPQVMNAQPLQARLQQLATGSIKP